MNSRFWLLAAVLPLAAAAQTAEPVADTDTDNLPPITVTGSHLLNADLTEMPVTTIELEEVQNSGARSLGEYLQSLPMMSGAPLNTAVGAREGGGAVSRGVESVELRGMGAERTLVLVNGRRMVAGGNGTSGVVDLASIPLAMVERIEILKNGASVEYGADAVAGVVNVITRRRMDGVQMLVTTEQTDRGDGQATRFSAVTGGLVAGADVVAGIEWFDQSAVGKGDRAFSAELLTVEGESNTIVPGGSSAPPQGNFRTSDGRVTLIDGRDGSSVDDFRPFISSGADNDRYNFNPFEDLVQDSQRLSAFVQFNRPLGALNWHAEALIQQRESQTRLAPLPFFTNRLEGVDVSADNVYNPFGEELSDARRRLVEAGPRNFSQDNRLWRVVTGLEGQWGQSYWNVEANYGRNTVDQVQSGDLLRDRVALALGPSYEADGQFRCGTPEATVDGCVPLNLFGGAGSITSDMLDTVAAGALRDRFVNEQMVLSGGLRRDLFELPAGPLTVAVGAEYREETASDTPDAQTRAGNTTGAAREATDGSYESQEVYLEMGVPLLSDRRAAKDLQLETGVRLVNYSNFASHAVFDAGVYYRPTDDWTLRAAYAQSFRAPTVAELYGGVLQSNPAVDDPCADFSQLTSEQVDRCVAQGVPADGSFDQTGNETPQVGGGNASLQPEEADILTAGAAWVPSALPGLRITLDYYDIQIEDGIAALGATTILAQCIENGADNFCSRIRRDTDGSILEVRGQLQNIASESARGLDLEMSYRMTSAWGAFQQRLLLSHVLERQLRAFPGGAPFVGEGQYDPDNFGAIPEWKGRYVLEWSRSDWQAGYGLQWIGALEETGGEIFPGTRNRIESMVYHDLHLGWMAPAGFSLTLGVSNLTDEDPPFIANADLANTDVSTYRLLGRTFKLTLNAEF